MGLLLSGKRSQYFGIVGFTNRQAPFWAHQQNPVSVTNDKNHDKPLEEYVGGRAPGVSLPLWSYKSRLLTPQTESRHHLLAEGCHPLQGDKHQWLCKREQRQSLLWLCRVQPMFNTGKIPGLQTTFLPPLFRRSSRQILPSMARAT